MEDPVKELAKISARLTPQRIVLTRIIMSLIDKHPTLNEIVEEARKTIPGIGISTTYNTIKMLEEAGLISIIEVDGRMRIDRPHPHVNIACTKSGQIFDVDGDDLVKVAKTLLDSKKIKYNGNLKITIHADC